MMLRAFLNIWNNPLHRPGKGTYRDANAAINLLMPLAPKIMSGAFDGAASKRAKKEGPIRRVPSA